MSEHFTNTGKIVFRVFSFVISQMNHSPASSLIPESVARHSFKMFLVVQLVQSRSVFFMSNRENRLELLVNFADFFLVCFLNA